MRGKIGNDSLVVWTDHSNIKKVEFFFFFFPKSLSILNKHWLTPYSDKICTRENVTIILQKLRMAFSYHAGSRGNQVGFS